MYPGSTQVALVGLEQASDRAIWQHALEHDFAIVTKDADFYDLSMIQGAPPYVVWLQTRNPDRAAVLSLLLDNAEAIQDGFSNGLAGVELAA